MPKTKVLSERENRLQTIEKFSLQIGEKMVNKKGRLIHSCQKSIIFDGVCIYED